VHQSTEADSVLILFIYSDGQSYCPVRDQSLPLVLPAGDEALVHLDTFGATATVDPNTTGQDSTPPDDYLLHAGGSIWALDWCPSTAPSSSSSSTPQDDGPSTSKAAQNTQPSSSNSTFLAVGCHPKNEPIHRIGIATSGPNSIQIWELDAIEKSKKSSTANKPRMAVAIGHNGGLTWHCKWCPSEKTATASSTSAVSSDVLPRLGLLSAALGDGTVQVWSVPQPHALPPRSSTHISTPAPVAFLSSRHLSGSLPSRVDWLPDAPHDLLLIGCWDGTVAIAKLDSTATTSESTEDVVMMDAASPGSIINTTRATRPVGLRLLCHFPAETQPLRAAKWLPAGEGSGSIDFANRFMFLTVGHEATIRIWDVRDQFSPLFSHQMTTATVLDASFSTNPLGIMMAVEDATLRGLLLDAQYVDEHLTPGSKPPVMFIWRSKNTGAIQSVATHPKGKHIAYSGEDGVVGLGAVVMSWHSRNRTNHIPLSAMKAEGGPTGVLRVFTRSELEQDDNGGLYCKQNVKDRAEALRLGGALVPDAAQIVHKVAWGPLGEDGAAWLAVGGAAGILRVQIVEDPRI
jgi:general transcription factor 3C polypeptide 2